MVIITVCICVCACMARVSGISEHPRTKRGGLDVAVWPHAADSLHHLSARQNPNSPLHLRLCQHPTTPPPSVVLPPNLIPFPISNYPFRSPSRGSHLPRLHLSFLHLCQQAGKNHSHAPVVLRVGNFRFVSNFRLMSVF